MKAYKKILVVDDSPFCLKMAKQQLHPFNVEVQTANNGLEALQAVQDYQFDLILMDICMPVLDGLRASRAIRRLASKSHDTVPIVAVSASADLDICVKFGMNDYFPKPAHYPTILRRWLPELNWGEGLEWSGTTH
jgi:two-component system, sensor histidine kinase and response regulator